MKIFCKILKLFVTIMLFGVFLSCSEDYESEKVLYPDNNLAYDLYPNDEAKNDSAASNLAHGIILRVHPQGHYQLEFSAQNEALPKLQLFRIYPSKLGYYKANLVRSLEGKILDGQLVYDFICEENEPAEWAATLLYNDDFYNGEIKNLRFKGDGIYSDHFSLNLIAVGNVEEDFVGFTLKDLADSLLQNFRKYYTSVTVDTLYVKYAHEHPTVGKSYPKNEPWVAGRSSEDFMVTELGGFPGVENALDLVLVNSINKDGILGYSNLFAGSLKGGSGSTVVLAANYIDGSSLINVPLENIVSTALHEVGHFFGLRHTTSTLNDIRYMVDFKDLGDYSNVDDGLEDTESCGFIINLAKEKSKNINSDIFKKSPYFKSVFYKKGYNCKDEKNLMFPIESDENTEGFSPMQLEIIRKNLTLFPH